MAKFLSLDNLTRAFGVIKIAFSSSTAKTTLADSDMFIIMDSADTETVNGVANVKKRKGISWANFKVELGNFFAAADALVFKGTLGTGGTVTALPTTYQIGWTYRVITAGTYAGNVCEVGDLIIAIVDRTGSGNLNADWTVAQNNADLSGVPTAADTNPLMDGVVAIGVSTKYARQDHVHPVDTSREAAIGSKNTAFNKNYEATATNIKMDGTQAVGSLDTIARGDHVHPTDTSRAASSHAHGNITNAGAIGSTTDLPVITGASGVLGAGSWASDAEIDAIVV